MMGFHQVKGRFAVEKQVSCRDEILKTGSAYLFHVCKKVHEWMALNYHNTLAADVISLMTFIPKCCFQGLA